MRVFTSFVTHIFSPPLSIYVNADRAVNHSPPDPFLRAVRSISSQIAEVLYTGDVDVAGGNSDPIFVVEHQGVENEKDLAIFRNSKYVQTGWGLLPLKHFFSESLYTADGEEISNKEVKRMISEAVAREDKQNPVTDDALADMLREKGYVIARRTIAKYREQLGIPVARLRRQTI